MQNTKRRTELALMNVLLCFMVIFIHVSGWGINNADRASWQYAALMIPWRLCSCAVPGFVFLSAVKAAFSADREGFSYGKYMLSRIKRVWFPYALAVLVYFLIFVAIGWMKPSAGELARLLLDGNMSYHFYFVVIIMQFYLLVPLWRWLSKKLREPVFAVIAVAASLPISQLFGQYLIDVIHVFYKGALFPYSDRVFTTYLFWWMLGLALGANYERVKAALEKNILQVGVFYALCAVHNVFFTYLNTTGRESVYWLETANILYVFSAVLFLFCMSCKMSDSKLADSFLTRELDGAAYMIYLWHPMALNVADMLISGTALSIFAKLSVRGLFGFIITPVVCIGCRFALRYLRRVICKKSEKDACGGENRHG